jgi:N-acetylglucosamine malate deacetylase 2
MAPKNPPLDGHSSGPHPGRQPPLIGHASRQTHPAYTTNLRNVHGGYRRIPVSLPSVVHLTAQKTNRGQKRLINRMAWQEQTHESKSVLAIFAHPDDETFRAGGTLALLAASGFRVHILTATRGEAGSCGTPPLCTTEKLTALRERELRCACQALGLEPPKILNYPDGQLSSIEPTKILLDIFEAIDLFKPLSLFSFGKDGLSGHPDHIIIGQSALQAFRKRKDIRTFYTLAVPKSIADELGMSQIQSLPDKRITHAIDISEAWDHKLKAIHCHQTQIHESPILKADQSKQQLFLGMEHFRLVEIQKDTNSKVSNDILRRLAN